ncbi:MAG TPA: recombination mediator RecR [Anaerolineaceae bacterium]|nr:recombination mediator RecR [Anaerolineaceae bacterium]HPN50368.1 recombination mediator RecR [Anaerolineaceae bacterium]
MPGLAEPVQNLVNALERLPGVGPKTASRLAFYLLQAPEDVSLRLAEALVNLKRSTAFCPQCFNIMLVGQPMCDLCAATQRDETSLCVVEEPLDILVIERTGAFRGRYHVLHGVLSPIEGVGPDDLKIRPLLERVRGGQFKEVILATNPSMEGDATALYLRQQMAGLNLRITRLARGLPVGSDLEYADQNTLLRALAGRQDLL